ncbi:hypothetical protein PSTG_02980 [Puccinia striiformis f. sp. tritici PST-78]|uniref:Uncharacterized protein n=1 Tax=Puccinia striiformis f. sp. tritici PST-78 TaxID=1165861 RepID=A0A0L0VXA4_9BASI|nr:hypothetical protein PSTG_02980 [Puccinia striiformis f. sp. tritici PST-78]
MENEVRPSLENAIDIVIARDTLSDPHGELHNLRLLRQCESECYTSIQAFPVSKPWTLERPSMPGRSSIIKSSPDAEPVITSAQGRYFVGHGLRNQDGSGWAPRRENAVGMAPDAVRCGKQIRLEACAGPVRNDTPGAGCLPAV